MRHLIAGIRTSDSPACFALDGMRLCRGFPFEFPFAFYFHISFFFFFFWQIEFCKMILLCVPKAKGQTETAEATFGHPFVCAVFHCAVSRGKAKVNRIRDFN